jgi:hypothetical protein
MGFRAPNLLRAAVTGERPETLSSAKVSKWRKGNGQAPNGLNSPKQAL